MVNLNKQIEKWLRIGILTAIAILLGMAFWLGQDVYTSFQKPQEYDALKDSIIQKEATNSSLDNAYMKMEVDKITGSYAAYGKPVDEKMQNEQVYYLLPLENGTYFLTIIANKNYIPQFDEMEKAFYNSIGKEEKVYNDPITMEGGFTKLGEKEQTLALEFFTEYYDASIESVDQLPQILSPYAFVIDEIGGMSISSLKTLFYTWIFILLVTLIAGAYYIYAYILHKKHEEGSNEKVATETDTTSNTEDKKVITASTIREIADMREFTSKLKEHIQDDEIWKRGEVFCTRLAKFVHAPVTLKEYQRMLVYVEDHELVEAILKTVKDYMPYDDLAFDTKGHAYAVALLSQCQYQRDEILNYLDEVSDDVISKENKGYGNVLYRNMKRLMKEYPDLEKFETKLKCFSQK